MTIRVLIAEDSPLFAEAMVAIVESDSALRVVGVAANGEQAVMMARSLRPDVMTMDLHMPVMGGLTAIDRIMSTEPLPILVVTSDPSTAADGLCFDALQRGALQVMPKPESLAGSAAEREALIGNLKLLAGVRVMRRRSPAAVSRWSAHGGAEPRETVARGRDIALEPPAGRGDSGPAARRPPALAPAGPNGVGASAQTKLRVARAAPCSCARGVAAAARGKDCDDDAPPPAVSAAPRGERGGLGLVALVASTGGPAALATILDALPPTFPVGIVVVQHNAPGFAPSLATWLNRSAALEVVVGRAGQTIAAGQVLIAPDGYHLTVSARGAIELDTQEPLRGHRPSGDRLLHSVAAAYGRHAIGVVLTGMGNDGSEGLLALRTAGGCTVAQDEASSVVYGMPKVAWESGAAQCCRGLEEMAPLLQRWAARNAREAQARLMVG